MTGTTAAETRYARRMHELKLHTYSLDPHRYKAIGGELATPHLLIGHGLDVPHLLEGRGFSSTPAAVAPLVAAPAPFANSAVAAPHLLAGRGLPANAQSASAASPPTQSALTRQQNVLKRLANLAKQG